jgi:hypothetical protein
VSKTHSNLADRTCAVPGCLFSPIIPARQAKEYTMREERRKHIGRLRQILFAHPNATPATIVVRSQATFINSNELHGAASIVLISAIR